MDLSKVYTTVFSSGLVSEIYLTRVLANFGCDVSLTKLDTLVAAFEEQTDERFAAEVQTQNGVKYSFHKFVDNNQ
jgi:uncharacterized protein YmfQ (DUF2313 family)